MNRAISIFTAGAFALIFATPAMAGVAKIENWGTSPNGSSTQYKITCTNGSTHRYWWQNGEWHGPYGSAGLSSYDINELASYRCG